MGLALGAAIVGFIAWNLRPTPARPAVSRFSFVFTPPEDLPGASSGYPRTDYPVVAVSQDGAELAYVARSGETTQIFLRRLDRLESQPLAGTADASSPFFSPGGQWVGFFANGKLKKVSVHGGELFATHRPTAAAVGDLIMQFHGSGSVFLQKPHAAALRPM
jgi:serine/threonine-protein kinase